MKYLISLALLVSLSVAHAIDVSVDKGPGGYAVVKTLKVKNSVLEDTIKKSIAEVETVLSKLKISEKGAPFIRTLEATKDTYHFQVGFPVNQKLKNLVGYDVIEMPSGPIAKASYTGDLRETYKAYDAIQAWAKKNKKTINGKPIESFLSEQSAPASSQKVEVVYPIK
tara:strand:+ start:4710 stop:5213 length:504 start_codon:yes stop_codon:yes gene_type:complete